MIPVPVGKDIVLSARTCDALSINAEQDVIEWGSYIGEQVALKISYTKLTIAKYYKNTPILSKFNPTPAHRSSFTQTVVLSSNCSPIVTT